MTTNGLLLLFLGFQVKHLLADFLWQTPWMLLNKGKYGHPGGIVHAGIHAVLSLGVLIGFGIAPGLSLLFAALEFVVHYHVDWAKDNIVRQQDYNHEQREYWVWFGADQFAHQITMLGLVALVVWYA